MKFKFIWTGRTRTGYLVSGINDYLKRIKRYVQVEVKEIKDEKIKHMDKTAIQIKEAKRIKQIIKPGEYVIALDEKGKLFNTETMADWLFQVSKRGYKTVTFLIGGPLGMAPDLIEKADLNLSLSPLTFTHEMARLILTEQLYRILTIWHGEGYHK
ncbi:MAG: 23S rRNA (pseudouridine(1915)-N(3))-methyltransferase RlmH [Candidatus Desulfofervidaceae bacterium]|nr:23S rRNA (pseudouridine(1915)-N(3))-methyltransferase RlmH [Candidatus Desulfofervidaceae bacterium]